jgi:hypothetical protein
MLIITIFGMKVLDELKYIFIKPLLYIADSDSLGYPFL